MAQRLDNGEVPRRPDTAPPGSRERSESDISGWSSARDETPSAREGRFHRAAQLRMAQPRTDVDDSGVPLSRRSGDWGDDAGPYGRDDRDDRYASGLGPRDDQGDDLNESPMREADYRPWDREGYDGGEPRREFSDARTAPSRGDRDRDTFREPPRREEWVFDPSRPRETSRGSERGFTSDRPRETSRGSERGFAADRPRGTERGFTSDRPGTSQGRFTERFRETPRASVAETTRRGRWEREPLTARDVMTRGVRTVRQDGSLREVAQLMNDEDCGAIPVVDAQDRLVGIVTDRDLVLRAFTGGRDPEKLRVADVMTDDVEAVTADDGIHGIIDLMGRRQVRRIPVVERDDRIAGIISLADLARRADFDEEIQEAFSRISSRRGFWSRLR